MKRSEINKIIQYGIDTMKRAGYPLPGFAYYTPEQWANLGEDEAELVHNMLGWDISDFGSEDFYKIGLTIFTFRNGNFNDKVNYPKSYAEKYLLVNDGQVLPFHYHWHKMEDIINRGGGDLEITLYNSTSEDFQDKQGYKEGKTGVFADTPVIVAMDGKKITVPAGGKVICRPGESITIMPGQYHSWKGVPGTGDVILFEVSKTNDDTVDNRFYKSDQRIPCIEEDEAAKYLIFADYPDYTKFSFGE